MAENKKNVEKTKAKTKTAGILISVLILISALIISPALAGDVPTLPMQVYGTAVDINGHNLSAGTQITAVVDNHTSTYTLTTAGKIGEPGTYGDKFFIKGETDGSNITFLVNNETALQKPAFESGALKELHLVFNRTQQTYTVTFNSTGGTPVAPAEVKAGETVAKPADPVKSGYNFTGWYTEPAYTHPYNFSAPVYNSFTLYAKWVKTIIPTPVTEKPVITASPIERGYFETQTTVTITCGTDNATIYYTTDGTPATNTSKKYTGPFAITTSTTVRALATKDKYEDSSEATEIFKKKDIVVKNGITIVKSVGGTLTADKTENVEYGKTVNITATPNANYVFSSWTIIGATSGKTVTKTKAVNAFAMWDEPVIITSVFTPYVPEPYAASIKVLNIPKTLYINDTGKLDAYAYDQNGKLYTNSSIIFESEAPNIISIDGVTGEYTAKNGGVANITVRCENASETLSLVVYLAPNPRITLIDPPRTAYVGILSDPVKVDTENTAALTWNWGDSSTPVTKQVNYPYPQWHTSIDTDSHIYTAQNTYTVSLTPANKYATGKTESIQITVDYAPPRNVKIVDGPASVTAGDSVYYTAFATGADKYRWYFDGVLQTSAGNNNSAVITIPDDISGNHTIKVVAWAGSAEPTATNSASAQKEILVSVKGGVLGPFGEKITQTPAKSAVGTVSLFSIDAVENAVRYSWKFGTETKSSDSPSVAYALKDTTTNNVTVTAYNSAGIASLPKVYSITPAGEMPKIIALSSTSGTSAEAGTSVTYSVTATRASSYKWIIDGTTQSTTTSSITRAWKDADVKQHDIVVYAINDVGESKKSMVFTVTPHKYAPAVIDRIDGPAVISDKHKADYVAVITSADKYKTTWYLDNVLLANSYISHGGMQVMLKGKDLKAGEHTLKLVVTTEHEEVSELEKTIIRTDDDSYVKNQKDATKALPKDNEKETLKLADSGKETSVMHLVDAVVVSDNDIRSDAGEVFVEVTPVAASDLVGFTHEMGNPADVSLALNITPHGLKNEKNLENSALITIPVSKATVANKSTQRFYRLDTGSVPEKWVSVPILKCEETETDYIFTLRTAGFSSFVVTTVALDESVPPVVENYTVSFNVQGHGVAPASQSVANGSTVTKPENPQAEGYTFAGWCLDKAGKHAYNFSTPVTGAFVLYAKWIDPSTKPVFNAVANASSKMFVSQSELQTMDPYLFTNVKSGKSILLNDSVIVKAVIGGIEKTIPAKIVDNRVVLDDPTSISGATSINVEFIGKKLGDADGDGKVTVNDAVKISQYLVSLTTLNEKGKFYGDPDGDGKVTVNDAVKVAQWLVHLVDDDYEKL